MDIVCIFEIIYVTNLYHFRADNKVFNKQNYNSSYKYVHKDPRTILNYFFEEIVHKNSQTVRPIYFEVFIIIYLIQ